MSTSEQARAIELVQKWLREARAPLSFEQLVDRWRQEQPDVSATAVRRAVWYLVDDQKAAFTQEGHLKAA